MTDLGLSENRLRGRLPAVGPTLEVLNLSHNFFQGLIPDSFVDFVDDGAVLNIQCNRFDCNNTLFTTFALKECVCPAGKGPFFAENKISCRECVDGTISVEGFVALSSSTCDGALTYDVENVYGPTYKALSSEASSFPQTWGPEQREKYMCVPCLHPTRCVGGECTNGAEGTNCERCKAGYYSMCSTCVPCPSPFIPYATILFVIAAACLGKMVHEWGFTPSFAVKMRLLVHFLQCAVLSLSVKVEWPDDVTQWATFASFARLDFGVANPECYVEGQTFYFLWCGAVIPFVLLLLIGRRADMYMKRHLAKVATQLSRNGRMSISRVVENGVALERNPQSGDMLMDEARVDGGAGMDWSVRRMQLRRVLTFFGIAMFYPVTIAVVKSQSCESLLGSEKVMVLSTTAMVNKLQSPSASSSDWRDNVYRDIFLADQRILCTDPGFQV